MGRTRAESDEDDAGCVEAWRILHDLITSRRLTPTHLHDGHRNERVTVTATIDRRFRLVQSIRVLTRAAACTLFLVGNPVAACRAADERPNILVAIADDWGWPHAGAYGDRFVKTPTFDRLAAQGVLFRNAFCASPSCTPSRGSLLTGQAVHRLEEGANLWSFLPKKFVTYPDLLEQAGYVVGVQGKGWGPGSLEGSGRERNPAGPAFKSFEQFLHTVPEGKPFCFWFGSQDPHRPYDLGSGVASGMAAQEVAVPPFLPDTPDVRSDICDYYFEVQRFDSQVNNLIDQLRNSGKLDSTMIIVTSDNGMPFPRCKANLYGSGTHEPLLVWWPSKTNGARAVDDFVCLTDLAPTILEAAGLAVPHDMTGQSLLGLVTSSATKPRPRVFLERERHANVRLGDLSYPCRAVRTNEFLYIRNLRPDRWPAGDPEMWKAVGPFGDIDGGPTKDLLLNRRDDPAIRPYFGRSCAKRPPHELYDLARDPWELNNVADKEEYAPVLAKLKRDLQAWMEETGDPRAKTDDDRFDRYPYFGREPNK
jgi:N-sulfoglucosamine sulfohydrolase